MNNNYQPQLNILTIRVSQADADKMRGCMTALSDEMQLDRNLLVFPPGAEDRVRQIGDLLCDALLRAATQASYAGAVSLCTLRRYFNAPSGGFPEQRPIIAFASSFPLHVECWSIVKEAIDEVNEDLQSQLVEHHHSIGLQMSTQPVDESDWYF